MIKILHILCSLNDGGIEKLLYDYYQCFDKKVISFDFAINDAKEGMIENRLVNLGSKVFRYTKFHKNFFKAVKDLNHIVDEGHYDIVHSHIANRGFLSAIHCHNKHIIYISHCHTCNEKENFLSKLIRTVTARITAKNSTYLFACGNDAGHWMWGKQNFLIMKNSIQVNNFLFNNERRNNYRDIYNLDDKTVILCVGRLSTQKNQLRLLSIFDYYHKNLNPNSILVLVGEGEIMEQLINVAKDLHNNSILFMGARNDVADIMSMSDIYILPSLYEGLPISVVEAQCSGLPCLLSSSITTEVKLLDTTAYFDLLESDEEIATKILKLSKVKTVRENSYLSIIENGYSLKEEAKKMANFYKRIIN